MNSIKRRTAIVTGGATGIGRAITMKLFNEGYNVVVADLNEKQGEIVLKETANDLGEIIFVKTNVTDGRSIEDLLDEAIKQFGNIHVLINNAGVAGSKGWELQPFSREEDWEASWSVNILGLIGMTFQCLPELLRNKGSRIVNIASISGRQGRPSLPHYSATKAAVINFTKSLHKKLEDDDITVNTVCPGLLWTPMWEQVGRRYANTMEKYKGLTARQVFDDMVKENMPLGREQIPEDVADLVCFFVAENSLGFSGQAVNVDGGMFLN